MDKRLLQGLASIALLVSLPLAAQDQSDVMEKILKCNEIADTDERLACYDRIGQPTGTAAPAAAAPAAAAPEAAQSAPVEAVPETEATAPAEAAGESAVVVPAETTEEDFGLPKEDDEFPAMTARVTKCAEANDRRWYFYLDNGQVWKYIGGRKLRYRSCDHPATIKEDSLGYKLFMEGEPGLRVQRYR